MILVICLDPADGFSFWGHRQSRDREMRKKLLELCGGSILRMNSYSAGQFEEIGGNLQISEDYLSLAAPGEFCFVEDAAFLSDLSRVEELIVFRWDKRYPADVRFSPLTFGERVSMVESFPGYSHEKIELERYLP